MKKKLVLAEKPAVARDLAGVLGVRAQRGASTYRGDGYVITWCIGHLVELEEPAGYRADWKAWSWKVLPMVPERFKLRAIRSTSKQWKVVRDLLRSDEFVAVVNACDAGREGELIFRYCYELAGCRLPIERLWISSLTEQAIRAGLQSLRPGSEYQHLLEAARSRAEADWLVGMNASRAVTLRHRTGKGDVRSVGRVQTPTLGLLTGRESEIRSFVPRDYQEVYADLAVLTEPLRFHALWRCGKASRIARPEIAEQVVARCTGATARGEGPVVEAVTSRAQREPPPLLFDLTSLQRTANHRYGMSAKQTLDVAQSLYERHKLITYPRTDCRYLSSDLAPQLVNIFGGISRDPAVAHFTAPLIASPPALPRRVFQDGKVREHHAIIPTQCPLHPERLAKLTQRERQILDLIVRRFLGGFYPDAEFELTQVLIRVGAQKQQAASEFQSGQTFVDVLPPPPDEFVAQGRVRRIAGWQEVAGIEGTAQGRRARPGPDEEGGLQEQMQPLPRLVRGQTLTGQFRSEAKRTQPPPRYSEASLLQAMESAGKHIEEEELRQQMKDVGLGTPATRAATIETLLKRGYIERRGKQLHPRQLGMELIEQIPVQSLASPELTGSWEARLSRIARGEETRGAFMADIVRYVQGVVEAARGNGDLPTGRPSPQSIERGASPPPVGPHREKILHQLAPRSVLRNCENLPGLPCPRCGAELIAGKRGWGCSAWRSGCPFVVPFEVLGRRLTDEDLRALIVQGASPPLRFHPAGSGPMVARLRLAAAGTPAGFFYLEAQ